MEFIQIEVQKREALGSHAARRMRREGFVPGMLYGEQRPNLGLMVPAAELERFVRTGSRLVELRMADKTRTAILREIQHDAITDQVLHVDFLRVDKDHEVEDHVPIVYKGRPKGVAEGGIFQALHDQILVRCRPADLPRAITLEVTEMSIGSNLVAGDVPLPERVTLLSAKDELLAHVIVPRVAAEAPAAGEEGVAAEPEVIRRAGAEAEEEGKEE
jgi:large subunit ribosomal protein L25